jgi:hypothetical protein
MILNQKDIDGLRKLFPKHVKFEKCNLFTSTITNEIHNINGIVNHISQLIYEYIIHV